MFGIEQKMNKPEHEPLFLYSTIPDKTYCKPVVCNFWHVLRNYIAEQFKP